MSGDLFDADERYRLIARHHRDQADAISPQALRELQATREEDGRLLYSWRQRRTYRERAERLEREALNEREDER